MIIWCYLVRYDRLFCDRTHKITSARYLVLLQKEGNVIQGKLKTIRTFMGYNNNPKK